MTDRDPLFVNLSPGEILRALVETPEGDPSCAQCSGAGWVNVGSDDEPCTGRCSCMPPSFAFVDGKLVPGTLEHFEKVDGKWVIRNRKAAPPQQEREGAE